MSLRILILSASAGAGHVRAAQAVELAARELLPDATIANYDVMTLTNAAFRRIYAKAYLDLVNRAPHVMGYVYDYFDRPQRLKDRRERLRRVFQRMNLRKLSKVLRSQDWDVAVSTHFLPAEIIAMLRKGRKLDTRQVVVTTDFDCHRMWVNEPAEAYTAATVEGKLSLARWGVAEKKVFVTGIPIHPVFAGDRDRVACRRAFEVGDGPGGSDRPVVLQLAGGFGVGPIGECFRALLSMETPTDILVVCGKNERARAELAKAEVPGRHRVRVLGFTDRMDELMACADVVVTKPGGLTTSEVLARGAAMAIINPTPGQEMRNADHVLEAGAGVKINSLSAVAWKVESLLKDSARLQRLRAASRSAGRPRAAYDVVQIIQDVAGRR